MRYFDVAARHELMPILIEAVAPLAADLAALNKERQEFIDASIRAQFQREALERRVAEAETERAMVIRQRDATDIMLRQMTDGFGDQVRQRRCDRDEAILTIDALRADLAAAVKVVEAAKDTHEPLGTNPNCSLCKAIAAYDAAKEERCSVSGSTPPTPPAANVNGGAVGTGYASAPSMTLRERLDRLDKQWAESSTMGHRTVMDDIARLTLACVEEELRVQILDAVTLARMITVLAAVRKELA